MRTWLLAVLLLAPTAVSQGQETPLLGSTLDFHDPGGAWAGGAFRLELEATRPDGSIRTTTLAIDNSAGTLHVRQQREKALIEADIGPGEHCELRLNGSTEIPPEKVEGMGLNCSRWRTMRDYHLFMWGLPMKLQDAGTHLSPVEEATTFQGTEVSALRVTWDESIGTDTWYVYFDSETAQAVGYRFYHDEAANDGEYIVLEGSVEAGGVTFPGSQAWYTNAEDRLLGTDTLVRAEVIR